MSNNLKSDYRLCEEIGRGNHTVVYRCHSLVSDKSFACKSINKRPFYSTNNVELLLKEPRIYRFLSKYPPHPNIIRMCGVYEDDDHLHMIFYFCNSGDLSKRIFGKYLLPESQTRVYFRDLMGAVAWCHRLGIVHRDIKPSNVLFHSTNTLKLIDFGSAEWFIVNERQRMMSQVVGTIYYMAPEVLSGGKYNDKVDVWSCGVLLYIMLTGFSPFMSDSDSDSDAETVKKILKGDLIFPINISSQAEDLLRKMLCKDIFTRLSAEEVLRHPWVTERDER